MSEPSASRAAAVCVVTVDDGPGGVRWALVSTTLDTADPDVRHRSRSTSRREVQALLEAFLIEAGMLDLQTYF